MQIYYPAVSVGQESGHGLAAQDQSVDQGGKHLPLWPDWVALHPIDSPHPWPPRISLYPWQCDCGWLRGEHTICTILIPSEISGTEGAQPCSNSSPNLFLPGSSGDVLLHSSSEIIYSNPSHFTDMETKTQIGRELAQVVPVLQLAHEKGHRTPELILLACKFLGQRPLYI